MTALTSPLVVSVGIAGTAALVAVGFSLRAVLQHAEVRRWNRILALVDSAPAEALPLLESVIQRGERGKGPAQGDQLVLAYRSRVRCLIRTGRFDEAAHAQATLLAGGELVEEVAFAWLEAAPQPLPQGAVDAYLSYLRLPDARRDGDSGQQMIAALRPWAEVQDPLPPEAAEPTLALCRTLASVSEADWVQYALGLALCRCGQWSEARLPLAKAVNADTRSSARRLAYGRACCRHGDVLAGRSHLLRAFVLGQDATAAREAGMVCWHTANQPFSAEESRLAGDPTPLGAAQRLLQVAIQQSPDDSGAWLVLGQAQARLGLHQDAVHSFQRGLHEGAAVVEDYLALTGSCLATGQRALARTTLAQALEQFPGTIEALELAADLAYADEDFHAALPYYQELPATQVKNRERLARCRMEVGDLEGVVCSLLMQPSLSLAERLILGRSQARLNRWAEALRTLEGAEIATAPAEYRYYLANALAANDRAKDAVHLLTALQQDPTWAGRAGVTLGRIALLRDDIEEAARWLDTPGSAATPLDLGRLALLQQDSDRARVCFAKAAKTDRVALLGLALAEAQEGNLNRLSELAEIPEFARWTLEALGHRAYQAGDHGQAAQAYERVLTELGNPSALVLGRLATSYAQLRRYSAAVPHLAELARRFPRAIAIRYNLAVCRFHAGQEHFRAKRWEPARTEWRRCYHLLKPLEASEADAVRQWELEATYRIGVEMLDVKPQADLEMANQLFDEGRQAQPDQTRWEFASGLTAALAGNHTVALRRFNECLQREPANAVFALACGLCHQAAGNEQEGERLLNLALERCQATGEAGAFLLKARLAITASHARQQHWTTAARSLEETLDHPLLASAKRIGRADLARTATALYALGGDRDQAGAVAKKYLPGQSGVNNLLLAVVQAEAGDFAGAATALARSYAQEATTEVRQLLASCLLHAAGSLVKKDDLPGAEAFLNRALQHDKNNEAAQRMRAAISFALQLQAIDVRKLPEMIRQCEERLKTGPSLKLLRTLGVLYHRRALDLEKSGEKPEKVWKSWRECLTFWKTRLLRDEDFWKRFGEEYNTGRGKRERAKEEEVAEWRKILPTVFARAHIPLITQAMQSGHTTAVERHLGLIWEWDPNLEPERGFLGNLTELTAAMAETLESAYNRGGQPAKKALGGVLGTYYVNAGVADFQAANELRERGIAMLNQAIIINKAAVEVSDAIIQRLVAMQGNRFLLITALPQAASTLREAVRLLDTAMGAVDDAKGKLREAVRRARASRGLVKKALQFEPDSEACRTADGAVDKVCATIQEESDLAEKFSQTVRENHRAIQNTLNQIT